MAKRPTPPSRAGKTAVQVFIAPAVNSRFRAACALSDADVSETVEKLMSDFADKLGIPKHFTDPPKRKP